MAAFTHRRLYPDEVYTCPNPDCGKRLAATEQDRRWVTVSHEGVIACSDECLETWEHLMRMDEDAAGELDAERGEERYG